MKRVVSIIFVLLLFQKAGWGQDKSYNQALHTLLDYADIYAYQSDSTVQQIAKEFEQNTGVTLLVLAYNKEWATGMVFEQIAHAMYKKEKPFVECHFNFVRQKNDKYRIEPSLKSFFVDKDERFEQLISDVHQQLESTLAGEYNVLEVPINQSVQQVADTFSASGVTYSSNGNTNGGANNNALSGVTPSGSFGSSGASTPYSDEVIDEVNEELQSEIEGKKEVTLGPITIYRAEEEQPVSTTADRFQVYHSSKSIVKFPSIRPDGSMEILYFKSPSLSYKVKQEGEEVKFKDLKVEWEGQMPIADYKFLKLSIIACDFYMPNMKESSFTGSVTLEAQLPNDILLSDFDDDFVDETGFNAIIHEGMQGQVTGNLNLVNKKVYRSLDFGGIQNINFTLLKEMQNIAVLEKGAVNSNNVFSGTIKLIEGAEYTGQYGTIALQELRSKFRMSPFAPQSDFELFDGNIKLQLRDLKNTEGALLLEGSFSKDGFSSSVAVDNTYNEGEFSTYGLTLDSMEVSATFTNKLNLRELSGNLRAKHYKVDGKFVVDEFLYDSLGLNTITLKGNVTYQGAKLNVKSARYDGISQKILLNVQAKVQDDKGSYVDVEIGKATIDKKGNLRIDGLNTKAEGATEIGPLTLEWIGQLEGGVEKDEGFTEYAGIEANAYIKTKLPEEEEANETKLASAEVSLKRKIDNKEPYYKDVNIVWEGDVDMGTYNDISLNLYRVNLTIPDSRKVTATGTFYFSSVVQSDMVLSNIIPELEEKTGFDFTIKEGVSGQMELEVSYNQKLNACTGELKFTSFDDLNMLLTKSEKHIASLNHGKMDNTGHLTGTLEGLANAKYKVKNTNIAVKSIDAGISMYPFKKQKRFRFTSGKATLGVTNLEGVKGELILGANFSSNNITCLVKDNESSLEAFGMDISDYALSANLDNKLNLKKIEGAVKAKHPKFQADIDIEQFVIEEGALTVFQSSNMSIIYNNFDFAVSNLNYKDKNLVLDAKMKVNLTGGEARAAVSDFRIDSLGVVTLRTVEGRLDRLPVLANFRANFKENGFQGNFDGQLEPLFEFNGNVDIGSALNQKRKPFYYGYLDIAAGANLPLGSTGLKLTYLRGQAGFNYALNYDANQRKFIGTPEDGTYLIGLGMGIGDMANLFEVRGNPIIQLKNKSWSVAMTGDLKIPAYSPVIKGELDVEYRSKNSAIEGDLTSSIKIPASTGKVINADQNIIGFKYVNENLMINAPSLHAQVMSVTDFNGSFSYNKIGRKYRGDMNGSFSFHYNWEFQKEVLGYEVFTKLNLDAMAGAQLSFTEKGIETSKETGIRFNVNGTLELGFKNLDTNELKFLGSSYDGNIMIFRGRDYTQLEGNVHFNIEASSWFSISRTENLKVKISDTEKVQ